MAKYAVVKNGIVINIILASSDFSLEGHELIELQEEQGVNIGDSWDGTNFVPAPKPESEPVSQLPSQEERLAALEAAMLEMVLGGAD